MSHALFLANASNISDASTTIAPAEDGEGRNMFIGIAWMVVIFVMFFAQEHVCDAYFVPAINVFIEKARKSSRPCINRWGEEAVAGATICALGCNGPELATNLIAMYLCNDAGIGVVIGSEIFNILVICGAATLASPLVPLPLERTPFARDCIFYLISIVLLFLFLKDGYVEFWEACTLFGLAVVFVAAVYFTGDVVNNVACLKPDEKKEVGGKKKAKVHGVEVDIVQVSNSRMMDCGVDGVDAMMESGRDGMMLTVDEADIKPNARGSVGINLGDPLLGAPMLYYKDLTEVAVMSEGVMRLEFNDYALIVTCQSADDRVELCKSIEEHDEKIWIHDYDATVVSAFRHLHHAWCSPKVSFKEKCISIPEFLIDVLLKSTLFLVDVKDVKKQGRWLPCFAGAMFWLATFSFLMLQIASQISFHIPALPESFLGITVCAIGTSLPNAVASVLMSSQGKPGAAIANALGSNIQNVFLAMALPWVIWILFPGEDCEEHVPGVRFQKLPMSADGLFEGVIWMLLTLALVIFFVLLPSFCTLNKLNGYFLCALFVVFLVVYSLKCFGVSDKDLLFGYLPVPV